MQAYMHAKEITDRIEKSHWQSCSTPNCEGHFDVDNRELRREQHLAVKAYFSSIAPTLYNGEIQHLDRLIKIESRDDFP